MRTVPPIDDPDTLALVEKIEASCGKLRDLVRRVPSSRFLLDAIYEHCREIKQGNRSEHREWTAYSHLCRIDEHLNVLQEWRDELDREDAEL